MMKMLTPVEVAEIIQIPYEAALKFIRFSGIDYIKVGRTYRVSEDKLNAFLKQRGKVEVPLS